MKIKISDSVICIPPHISTTWDLVAFIQSEKEEPNESWTLIFHLSDGKVVKVPHLDASLVDIAFNAHMKYLENSGSQKEQAKSPAGMFQNLANLTPEQMGGLPLQFNLPGGLGGMENAMQHNPAQSDSPPVPKEILEKISGIVQLMTNGDTASFPKPEPHCNCMHCQIARALHGKAGEDEENSAEEEEPVSEEDLKFRTWDIVSSGEQLYTVTNPLDPQEQYSVYLGTPVGCTCGKPHCEHIRAVLSS